MKHFALLTLLTLLFALPALAQTDLGATYTLDSGTSIDYPEDWTAELQDSLVVLSHSDISRAIVIDYPIVAQLIETETLQAAISVVADQLFEDNFNADSITPFTVLGRDAARYDVLAGPNTSAGAIVAVRFSNERIGMIIAINIAESTLARMIESFDNTSPANDNAIVPSGGNSVPATSPDTYFYQAGGRFIIPMGWSAVPRLLNNEIEYATLQTADGSVTGILFDLSDTVSSSVELDTVVATSGINLQSEFGVNFSAGEFVRNDNRTVYRYSVTVNGQSGMMVAVHYDDGGTGLAVFYGDTASYTADINLILGSFNNLGALMNYIQ